MLFIISRISIIYRGRFRFDSIHAYRPRYDSDPIIVRSLVTDSETDTETVVFPSLSVIKTKVFFVAVSVVLALLGRLFAKFM